MTRRMMPLAAATALSLSWAGAAWAQDSKTRATPPANGLSALAAVAQATPDQDRSKKPGSLYDRLGGIFPIAAVVDRFSDAIIENPKLNQNAALVEWNSKDSATRLAGLKFMRTLWVAALAGGPFKYTGLALPVAHKDLRLTEEEFNEVGAEIVRALDFYNVPEAEKQELVSAYMQSKPQVVTASKAPGGGAAGD